MSGRKTKYENYLKKLSALKEPEVPDVELDMRGAIAYANSKGVQVSELSKEEKRKFIVVKQ